MLMIATVAIISMSRVSGFRMTTSRGTTGSVASERRRPGGWPCGVLAANAGETPAGQPARTPAFL
jgi:hypothetical protein